MYSSFISVFDSEDGSEGSEEVDSEGREEDWQSFIKLLKQDFNESQNLW